MDLKGFRNNRHKLLRFLFEKSCFQTFAEEARKNVPSPIAWHEMLATESMFGEVRGQLADAVAMWVEVQQQAVAISVAAAN